LNVEEIRRRYRDGLAFHDSIRLTETVEANENFYIGKQWEGVKSNGLPTPVFNFLKQIVQHQVASITGDSIRLQATPLRSAGNRRRLTHITDVVNAEFEALFERNRIPAMLRTFARNAAVDGDACMFSWWDPETDSVRTEVIENTRVFFGDPNERDVQAQPWILLARREPCETTKRSAKYYGGDTDLVPDEDENRSPMELRSKGRVTRLTCFERCPDTGTIRCMEIAGRAVVRPEWDMDVRLYPLVWLSWDAVRDCCHGQALITGLIPNQQFVNKAYAMAMVSLMMSAFPRTVYDRTRVAGWTNQVGAAVGVNGDVTGVAKLLEPAQISPQVSQFIASAVEHTQTFSGATPAALGNTRPDNTSAIVALQRAAAMPSEITRRDLYQAVEDLGRIYLEFMANYYGRRTLELPLPQALPEAPGTAGAEETVTEEFDFSVLKELPLYLDLDVGASAFWSEIASIQTLDNLLSMGAISLEDYLERVPDGYVARRRELLDKVRARAAATAQQ
jgi:hypothetical protein